MDFNSIATVTGKSGLFRVLKGVRTGFILESLDEEKARLVTSPNTKVSLLSEVSIYTLDKDGSVPLEKVMKQIFRDYGKDPGVDPGSDSGELRAFMKAVVPKHDENRVYTSDIRKLIRWYEVLLKEAPETLSEEKKD